MRLQPIVYTDDMDRATDWYTAVLGAEPAHRSAMWTSFDVAGGHLALHHAAEVPAGSAMTLSLVSDQPLEAVVQRLGAAGIALARGIQDETFGRSIVVEDPGGMLIQVNEHD